MLIGSVSRNDCTVIRCVHVAIMMSSYHMIYYLGCMIEQSWCMKSSAECKMNRKIEKRQF